MANESRLSITIDSRSAEQQAKDLETALGALEGAGIRVVSATDRAGKSSTTAGRSFSAAGREARQGSTGVDDLNRSLDKIDESASKAAATVSRVLKATLAGFSAMHVIDTADEWGQYASRIRMATDSVEEYEHVQQRMAKSSQITYRAINETRESFIQLSPVLRDMGLSLDQSIDAVDTFSGLLVVNGANAQRGAAAMESLAKSFQRGRVDAQAWMTIYSTVDNIVDLLAESSGKAATEIRKMGVEGKISAEMMAKALVEGNEQIIKSVEAMPTTVRDALQNLNTAFTEYVGWGNEAKGITAGLASGIEVLGNNFETVANIVGGVVATALFVYTARTIESTRATIASFAARTHAAKATLDEAQAQAAQTATTLAQTRAMMGLTATHAQVIAATKAHEASLKQLAMAQAGYTRAGMALLGVLGGPVGLGVTAALAAASFLVFRSSADDTAVSTQGLTREVNLLTEAADKLTAAQANQAMAQMDEPFQKAKDEAMKYRAQVEYLTKQLEQFPNSGMVKQWSADLVQARGNADTAAQVVAQYEARLADLQARLDAVTGAQQATNAAMGQVPDAVQKQLATLDRQISLFGKTGQAAQVYYDLERGALKDLAPEHKQLIRDQADVLAGKEKTEDARRKGVKSTAAEAKEIDGLLKVLREQVSVLGMTEQQAARYRIETAKGTAAQKQAALAMLDQVQSHDRLKKAGEAYKSLLLDLRTDQQRSVDLFKEQKKALDEAGVSAEEYARVMARMSEVGIGTAPKFGGLDASVGGASGELIRLREAQAELEKWRTEELAKQKAYLDELEGYEQQYAHNVLNINRQFNEQQANLQASWRSASLANFASVTGDAADMLKQLGGESNALYKAMFIASKAASIAQAVINTELAATRAVAELGPVAGPPMAMAMRGLGYASVGIMAATALTGMAHDGINSVPREGTWLLDKGERVLSARQNSDLTNYLKGVSSPAGASNSNITIQVVVNAETGEADVSGTDDAQMRQLGTMIAASARQVIVEEMRPHGLLDRNR